MYVFVLDLLHSVMACSIAIHCIMNTIVCVYLVAITFLSDVSADNPSTSTPVSLQHCQILMDCNINLAIDPLPSPTGKQGPQGPQGETGDKGENGLKGVIGARGLVGVQGNQGFHGRPGMPGSCRCNATNSGITASEGDGGGVVKAPLGSKSNPVASCNFLPEAYKTGIYWIKDKKPFQVKCDLERNLTCIDVKAETPKVTHRNKTFWLSEVGIRIADFFNGVSVKNLRRLRTQSLFTIQTLRYHCNNSYVYSKDDDDHNLRVMNLKGKIMGPKPSERNPFFYYVTADTDGCKVFKYSNKGGWQHTDIELISTTQQLPVIDLKIRDIKNGENQEFYIEHRELCFG